MTFKPEFFVLIVVSCALILTTPVSAGGFGQECSPTDPCTVDSFLYCSKYNTCSCLEGIDLVHDTGSGKCLLATGANCDIISAEGEPTCYPGSKCTRPSWGETPLKGHCTCERGFQNHLQDRKCVPRIPFGESCRASAGPGEFLHQCLEFASCVSDKCACESGLIYDPQNQQCVFPTGAPCETEPVDANMPTCSPNSVCTVSPRAANLAAGICTCRNGFVNIPGQNRCIQKNVPIGGYCEAEIPAELHSCNGLSTCSKDGRCDCSALGGDVGEDLDTKACALRVGSTCFKTVDPTSEPQCVTNSECLTPSWSQDQTKGLCSCNGLFEQVPESRTCLRRLDVETECEYKRPDFYIRSCIKQSNCVYDPQEGENLCTCWEGLGTTGNDLSKCDLKGSGLSDEACYLGSGAVCTDHATCEKRAPPPRAGTPGKMELELPEEEVVGFCKCGRGYPPNTQKVCAWSPRDYDGVCEIDIECNHQKSMSCTNQKCKCFREPTMTFDPIRGECVSLVGQDGICSLKPEGENEDILTKCVLNANCIANPNNPAVGFCECGRGFTVTAQKTCDWTPKDFDGVCEVDIECNHQKSMSCVNKKCKCFRETTMTFDPIRGECVSLVGQDGICSLKPEGENEDILTKCVLNANCIANPNNPAVGFCECGRGFTVTAQKTCDWTPKDFDGVCEVDIECNHQKSMSCVNKKCGCFRADSMVYNETVGECLTLAGPDGICSLGPEDGGILTKCVLNANCIPKSNNPAVGFCECGRGYDANSEKYCQWAPKAYNQICEENIECNHKKSMSCSSNNKRCECVRAATMIYNATKDECLTLVGPDGICSLTPDGDIETQCVLNAECKPKPNNPTVGYCDCSEGFVVDEETSICGNANGAAGTTGVTGALFFGLLPFAILLQFW